MNFYYEGIELATKQTVHGEFEAVSEQAVVRWLEEQRIEALSVKLAEKRVKRGRKVRTSDLVLPLQELAILTEQGVTLVEALKALSDNVEHPSMARGFSTISSEIEVVKAFRMRSPGSVLPFPKYVPHLISAGEAAGQLTLALRNASQQVSYDQSVRDDLRAALTYPFVLVVAGIMAMLIIFLSVVPKFTHLLEAGRELPPAGSFCFRFGKVASDSPWILLIGFVVFTGGLILVSTNKKVRNFPNQYCN